MSGTLPESFTCECGAICCKVDKGVRLPTPRRMYDVAIMRMNVGDSFLVPTNSDRNYVMVSASKLGINATSRKTVEGYRIWRIRKDAVRMRARKLHRRPKSK